MKWMIASDIHGSAYWGQKLLEAFDAAGADRLLLLGDLLYHGPRNALPEGYDPMKLAALLNGRRDRIMAVRGNCDAEIDQAVLNFPMMADYALLSAGNRLIFATHGHLYSDACLPPLCRGDILLHGHTHIKRCEEKDGILFLNPGSVSIPKDGPEHSCMLLEEDSVIWQTLDGKMLLSKTI